jgi:hypothetical protein
MIPDERGTVIFSEKKHAGHSGQRLTGFIRGDPNDLEVKVLHRTGKGNG